MPSIKIRGLRGINNRQSPEDAGPSDIQVGKNIDIDDSGSASTRPGSTLVYAGNVHSLPRWNPDFLFRESTYLKRLDPVTGSAEILRGGFTAGLPLAWLRVNDTLYYTDGELTGKYVDGRDQSWGLEVPLAPDVVSAAGDLLDGRYKVCTTYVRNDGQESGASPQTWFDVSQGGLSISFVASADPEVSGIAVYCSAAHGSVLFRQSVVPNQAGSVSVTSRLAVGVGVRCSTLNCYPPPAGTLLSSCRGRVYIGNGQELWHTADRLRYDLVELDKGLMIFAGETTMLEGLENGLWVGTTRGTQFLYGKDPYQPGGFEFRGQHDTYPVIGTSQIAERTEFPLQLPLASGKVAVWPTPKGIYVGDGEGRYINYTGKRWAAPDGSVGTGFVRDGQYIFGILGTPGSGSGSVRVSGTGVGVTP